MNNTLINQYCKPLVKEYVDEFYQYVFTILNNLIDVDLPANDKLMFLNSLIFDRTLVAFEVDGKVTFGRYQIPLTRDVNLMPIDIVVRTLNGNTYNLIDGKFALVYNPIPVDYLRMKISEISNIEKIINYVRKLYKVPFIFKSKDSKIVKSIKEYIQKIFDYDSICEVVSANKFNDDDLTKIDTKIDYITDKLLDENESLKEDILEIFGIYKNTSGNRERVNESELIISNSLTTINKLGLESTLKTFFDDINNKFGTKYTFTLNINKLFDNFERGVE